MITRLLKGVSTACAVVFMATAQADLTQIDVDNAWFSGIIFTSPLPNPVSVTSGEGGGGLNLVPVSYFFTRKPGVVGGFNTSITIKQTKRYTIVTNKFTPLDPWRTVVALQSVTKAVDRDDGTDGREDDIMGKLLRSPPWNTSDDTKWGRFTLEIQLSSNNGPWQIVLQHSFIISPIGLRDANLDGGSNPNGGGITPGDLGNQNVNKDSFWSGIFRAMYLPSQSVQDAFKEALMKWSNWGPFGIIAALNDELKAYEVDKDWLGYTITLDIPFAGPSTMDLNPYATYIKIGRFLMSMTVWFLVLFGLWQKVFKKV